MEKKLSTSTGYRHRKNPISTEIDRKYRSIALQMLKGEKEEFLDHVLRPGQIDVLYSVKFKKKDLYIWLLVEHQSTQDRFLPFRVLKYALRICEYHLNKDKTNKELPKDMLISVDNIEEGEAA